MNKFMCIRDYGKNFIQGRIYSSILIDYYFLIIKGEFEGNSFLFKSKQNLKDGEDYFGFIVFFEDYFISMGDHRQKVLNELLDV